MRQYFRLAQDAVRDIAITLLLKYLLGLCGLPLDEKFGLNGPVGGFLRVDQVELIGSIIDPDELALLRKIALQDPSVQSVVAEFESLPDITDEEFEAQSQQFDEFMKEHSR